MSNIGGSYFPGQHEFICPTPGVYIFSLVILSTVSQAAGIKLMVDNSEVVTVFAMVGHGQGTNIAMIECGQGQKVWAEPYRGNSEIHGSTLEHWNWSTFSGMLVHTM